MSLDQWNRVGTFAIAFARQLRASLKNGRRLGQNRRIRVDRGGKWDGAKCRLFVGSAFEFLFFTRLSDDCNTTCDSVSTSCARTWFPSYDVFDSSSVKLRVLTIKVSAI